MFETSTARIHNASEAQRHTRLKKRITGFSCARLPLRPPGTAQVQTRREKRHHAGETTRPYE
jgi:hypothetical protein